MVNRRNNGRVWWVAGAMTLAVALSIPAVFYRQAESVFQIRPSMSGLYAQIVPNRLLPLKDNVGWDESWERWPLMNVPRHPLDIVGEGSIALREWIMKRGERANAGWEARPVALDQLNGMLAVEDLSALALLEAGQWYELGGDSKTAAVWFRHGVRRGRDELADLPAANDMRARRLAETLLSVQDLMWLGHNSRRVDQGTALLELYPMLITMLPEDDEQKVWAKIGVGDALYVTGSSTEALDIARSLRQQQETGTLITSPQQTAAIDYLKGLALRDLGRLDEAIEYLERACTPVFHHAGDAAFVLLMIHCQREDWPAARLAAERWRRIDPLAGERESLARAGSSWPTQLH